MVASKVGTTAIHKSYFKKYTFSASLWEILFKLVCAGAEKSAVGPWTAVWGSVDTEMFPKLFSKSLISRETFQSIYKGKKNKK